MFHTMVARKKETDFNEYFDALWDYARSHEMSKGRFMKLSGLSAQRFSEFSQRSRNITGEYFIKMLAGLELSYEEFEQISGRPFSEDQRLQLQFDNFVKSHKDFLEALMKEPAKLKLCRMIIQSERFWTNPYIRRIISKILPADR